MPNSGSTGTSGACPITPPVSIVPELTAHTEKHIFEGEIRKGKGSGVHHHSAIAGGTAKYIPPADVPNPQPFGDPPGLPTPPDTTMPLGPDPPGLYQSYVAVKNGVGVFKPKPDNVSSFFPKTWSQQKVKEEISEAFSSKTIIAGTNPNSVKWEGVSASGVKIRGTIDKNGDIISAYPTI